MVKTRNDHDDLVGFIYPEPPDSFIANARFPTILFRVPSCLAIEKYIDSILIVLPMPDPNVQQVWIIFLIFENKLVPFGSYILVFGHDPAPGALNSTLTQMPIQSQYICVTFNVVAA
jgi:hypothetical protein